MQFSDHLVNEVTCNACSETEDQPKDAGRKACYHPCGGCELNIPSAYAVLSAYGGNHKWQGCKDAKQLDRAVTN